MSDFLKKMKESLETGKKLDENILDNLNNIQNAAENALTNRKVEDIEENLKNKIKGNERTYNEEEMKKYKEEAERIDKNLKLEEGFNCLLSTAMNIDSQIDRLKENLEKKLKDIYNYKKNRKYIPNPEINKMFEKLVKEYGIEEPENKSE